MRHSLGSRRGAAALEFALSTFVWVPLLLGLYVIGFNLIRAIQVTQVTRDAANMFAKGVNFSETANQDVIYRVASGLNFKRSGGQGTLFLSSVMYIGAAQCTAAGKAANTGSCPNLNQPVITRRLVMGNAQAATSAFGTPRSAIVASDGYLAPSSYLTESTARATGFNAVLPLTAGEVSYVVEMFQPSPDLDVPGFMSGTGVYARSLF
jgi:hypothetical protein